MVLICFYCICHILSQVNIYISIFVDLVTKVVQFGVGTDLELLALEHIYSHVCIIPIIFIPGQLSFVCLEVSETFVQNEFDVFQF